MKNNVPFCNQEEEAERLIGCRVADMVGFKNDLQNSSILELSKHSNAS
jgi:hypothetical protein